MYETGCLPENKTLNKYSEPLPDQGREVSTTVSVIAKEQVKKNIAVDRYKEGKLLAKTLCVYPKNQYFTMRFDQEVSEFRSCKIIRASSTSLLIPEKKCDLYRHVGLLLDSGKCAVRGVYDRDAAVRRMDSDNDEVEWCVESNQFLKKYSGIVTTYTGDFWWSQRGTGAIEFSCLDALIEYSNKTPEFFSENLLYVNEVVVDYGVDSIMGLVGTKNIGLMSSYSISEQELHEDLISLSLRIKELSGHDCPVFEYDMSSGNLFEISGIGT